MSDQGDAGQWRPATNQSDQYSTTDDTTGPLPAVAGDDDGTSGFPSAGATPSPAIPSWSVTDDDVPTGGFLGQEPPAYEERSVFEPADRTSPRTYEPAPGSADPGPTDVTPQFGTDVPESWTTEPVFDYFGTKSPEDSVEHEPSRSRTYGEPENSWGPGAFSAGPAGPANPAAPAGPAGPAGPPASEDVPSASGSFGLPPAQGVTPDDQDAENEFFASDDHPPMWDKVVAPAGPPPKPGKPSSGNLRLPEWMRDENSGMGGPTGPDALAKYHDEEEARSRRPLYIGLGVVVVGLVAVGGVYALKGNGGSEASNASAPTHSKHTTSAAPGQPGQNQPTVNKRLPRFKGVHTKAAGRISDPRAGLSYARLAQPWAPATQGSPMNEIGFSTSQFAVTEKAGGEPKHWARLMSAQLSGAAKNSYTGPGSEREAATELGRVYEERMFGFQHKKRILASQPLDIGGHKGWLVSDYLRYHRPGLKATGDVVAVAVVDTGKQTPGVLFMSVPNTSRTLWPDINFVVRSLRVG